MPTMSPRAGSVVALVVSAAFGVAIAAAGGAGGERLGGLSTFAWLVIVAFGVNIVVFVPSYLARTEHFFDLTGSLTYLTISIVAFVSTGDADTRTVLLAAMITIWAARLGSFLFQRVTRDGGDGRFDSLKTDGLVFLRVWVLQGPIPRAPLSMPCWAPQARRAPESLGRFQQLISGTC